MIPLAQPPAARARGGLRSVAHQMPDRSHLRLLENGRNTPGRSVRAGLTSCHSVQTP